VMTWIKVLQLNAMGFDGSECGGGKAREICRYGHYILLKMIT